MNPAGLPQLFQPSRTLKSVDKPWFWETKQFSKMKNAGSRMFLNSDSGFQTWEFDPGGEFLHGI